MPKRVFERGWCFSVTSRSGRNPNLLSESMSRSGESLSPKRECEECSIVVLTGSSGERFDVLGET